ncbi:class I SAM-dependent methyltransferase [bacterium]|nr:class I SAM-dependent methyltransferase [bacterium]
MPKTGPFEEYSARYDEWFERNLTVYHYELEAILELLPAPEANGLEVGVGSGKFAVPLGIKTGVEPSEKMAIKAVKQGIRVIRSVAEDLPFFDSTFDYVLMVTTICFVDDILKSFREAFRVLKPYGCIIVGFVDKESELGKQYREKRNASVFYKEATFFSTQQVCTYLTDAGFGDFTFKQTLIPGETKVMIQNGFGRGAFVVAKAVKNGKRKHSARKRFPFEC